MTFKLSELSIILLEYAVHVRLMNYNVNVCSEYVQTVKILEHKRPPKSIDL